MATRLALDTEDPTPEPMEIGAAYRLIRSCPEPTKARQEIEGDIICGELKPIARRAIYRQSSNALMAAKNPVVIDGKVWARIEADKQTDAFWTGDVVKSSGSGGGAVDLMKIVVDPARIMEVASRHGAEQVKSKKSRPNAGAPVREHVPAISFVMTYLRALPEGLATVGRADSNGKIAALMLELHSRTTKSQGAKLKSFECPLTQANIGDLVGMTSVHISRVLSWFRSEGVADWSRGVLRILDEARLRHLTGLQARELVKDLPWLPRNAEVAPPNRP